jgi:hypothetical protein
MMYTRRSLQRAAQVLLTRPPTAHVLTPASISSSSEAHYLKRTPETQSLLAGCL